MARSLWEFPSGALFLLSQGALPEEPQTFKGKLWQCKQCGRAPTTSYDVKKMKCTGSKKKKKNNEQYFWFNDDHRGQSMGGQDRNIIAK